MALRVDRYSYLTPANSSEEMKRRREAESFGQSRRDEQNPQTPDSPPRATQDFSASIDYLKQKSPFGKPDYTKQQPKNFSSAMTHRLVGANSQMMVRQIISKVNSEMINLRFVAAGNDSNARAAEAQLRRLQKVINRANRKLRDLDIEDNLKIEHIRAERAKKKDLAEKLATKLRKERTIRYARENGYLIEEMHDTIFGQQSSFDDSTIDEATAEMLAQIEMAAVGSGDIAEIINEAVAVEADSVPTEAVE